MRLSAYLHFAVDELLESDLSYLPCISDYDTCWAARLTNEDGSLAYPHLLDELLGRQHPDGSWGSREPYGYDRLLTTLAVVLLLARFGGRQRDKEQRLAGQRYIWQQAAELDLGVHPTVGFEMILPTLLKEGQELELDLPYTLLGLYEEERKEKLRLLPVQRLFETRTTALFSLEAFAGNIDLNKAADNLLSRDGSMATSPSATAWLLGQVPNWRTRLPKSAAYVEGLLARYGVGLPTVAPYDIFARAWLLYYLYHGGLLDGHEELLSPHYRYLYDHWSAEGIGWSSTAIPDADDTAMVLLALRRAGHDVDGTILLSYEREQHFAVFDYERDPSVSANLHILEASCTLPERDRQRVRDKILTYVFGERQRGTFWTDKWHASFYYPTSQALAALLPYAPDEMDGTLRWLLSTQRADGSWGQYASTAEETALVLFALLLCYRAGRSVPQGPMRRAARYLLTNEAPFSDEHPELWIAKALFAPTTVIRSIVLAALKLYQDSFGGIA
jgi:halimadienyl-diphosphate synthase